MLCCDVAPWMVLGRQQRVPLFQEKALALANALGSRHQNSQQAMWKLQAQRGKPLPLFDASGRRSEPKKPTNALSPLGAQASELCESPAR